YKDGEYLTAAKLYGLFLEGNPKDPRAGKARVMRAMSGVRQYASGAGPVWTNALDAARDMVRTVGKEREYGDASADLAELVLKTAEGLADRARASGDPKALEQAEAAVGLHERIAGKAAAALRGRTRVPAKMVEARAAVRKTQSRAAALAAMAAAVK